MTSVKCTALELEFTTNINKHHKYRKAPFLLCSEEQLWHQHNNKLEIFPTDSIYLHDNSTFAFNAEKAKKLLMPNFKQLV